MKYRNAASASIGTSISSGQTIFFNSEGTWTPHSPIPSLMVWNPRIMQDPRGNEYVVRNEKNKKALDSLYSTNMTAAAVNNKHLQSRKVQKPHQKVFKVLNSSKIWIIILKITFL